MAVTPPTEAECVAELAELRALKKELLRIPVSGSVGSTSMNYGGRIAEIDAEIDRWELALTAALNPANDTGLLRPQIEV